MKRRLLTNLMLLAFLILPALSGCDVRAENPAGMVAVTDLLGREVLIPAEVERVVAIGPGALRLYAYAGKLDYLVGVEQIEVDDPISRPYMVAHPSLVELPVIGPGGPNNAPDPEKILTVAPDVILSTYAVDSASADELYARTGIPVVALSYGPLGFGVTAIFDHSILDSLLLIGQITRQTSKAQRAVEMIRQAQQDLDSRTQDIHEAQKPSVYVGALGARGTHGVASTQGDYALLNVIHAKNVVDETGTRGSVIVDKEKLLVWDPDFLFLDLGGYAIVREDYQKNPSFYQSLSAVNNGRVYAQLPYNSYHTNIDTAIANAYYLGKVIYPSAFSDINPVEKADEIYQALLGKPVYDQMARVFGGFGNLTLAGPVSSSPPLP